MKVGSNGARAAVVQAFLDIDDNIEGAEVWYIALNEQ